MQAPYLVSGIDMLNTRRQILSGLSALSLSACATVSAPTTMSLGASPQKGLDYLFTLGVASGDPVSDGFVLWTRLAPMPLAANGGLSAPINVTWQVSEDENFARIIKAGQSIANQQWAHSVPVSYTHLTLPTSDLV